MSAPYREDEERTTPPLEKPPGRLARFDRWWSRLDVVERGMTGVLAVALVTAACFVLFYRQINAWFEAGERADAADRVMRRQWQERGGPEAAETWCAAHGIVAIVSCRYDGCDNLDVVPEQGAPFVLDCDRGDQTCRLRR